MSDLSSWDKYEDVADGAESIADKLYAKGPDHEQVEHAVRSLRALAVWIRELRPTEETP